MLWVFFLPFVCCDSWCKNTPSSLGSAIPAWCRLKQQVSLSEPHLVASVQRRLGSVPSACHFRILGSLSSTSPGSAHLHALRSWWSHLRHLLSHLLTFSEHIAQGLSPVLPSPESWPGPLWPFATPTTLLLRATFCKEQRGGFEPCPISHLLSALSRVSSPLFASVPSLEDWGNCHRHEVV